MNNFSSFNFLVGVLFFLLILYLSSLVKISANPFSNPNPELFRPSLTSETSTVITGRIISSNINKVQANDKNANNSVDQLDELSGKNTNSEDDKNTLPEYKGLIRQGQTIYAYLRWKNETLIIHTGGEYEFGKVLEVDNERIVILRDKNRVTIKKNPSNN